MDNRISTLEYFSHLFWLLGTFYINVLFLHLKQAKESLIFIRLHLTHKAQLMQAGRKSNENTGRMLFGFVVTNGVLYLLYVLMKIII